MPIWALPGIPGPDTPPPKLVTPAPVQGIPAGNYPPLPGNIRYPSPKIGGTPAGYYRLQDGLPLPGGRRSAVPTCEDVMAPAHIFIF